ncbi:MAG TPA: hypothetical protein CFH84_07425 [Sulfurimonas sp. UBA12504]|nr:MAG: hypothetical protein A2019_06630 [Sulfurimonas sp. GWF2_37_8]DAB29869.1 MAG TPA: hypothetical protein CFH84_07425 [Sulfurimonas sp. UBA12504]
MKHFLHIGLSCSLFFIGEYTLDLVLQLVFVSTFFKNKKLFYLFYMPMFFLALVKIFASTFYLLYFINLFFLFKYLEKSELLLSIKELFLWSVYMASIYLGYISLDAQIYAMYILQNIQDKVNHLFIDVVFILALLHILIFVILGYNKKILFRK